MAVPRALRDTLEKGRPEYERLIRQTRWGEAPVLLIGSGASQCAAMAGACAFESLLGWAAVARSSLDFRRYGTASLSRRTIVLALSQSGESSDTLEAARAARTRGASVLAVTCAPESSLARAVDGVFRVRPDETNADENESGLMLHAAAEFVALETARILKPPSRELNVAEQEFQKLPLHVEWALTQLRDAIRSFASQLKGQDSLWVAAGGAYHAAALAWAFGLRERLRVRADVVEPGEVSGGLALALTAGSALVALSGSRCRMRKEIQEFARRARAVGAKICSVTDANDVDLERESSLAFLLPPLGELSGSVLTLAVLERVTAEWAAGSNAKRNPAGTSKTSRRDRRRAPHA